MNADNQSTFLKAEFPYTNTGTNTHMDTQDKIIVLVIHNIDPLDLPDFFIYNQIETSLPDTPFVFNQMIQWNIYLF